MTDVRMYVRSNVTLEYVAEISDYTSLVVYPRLNDVGRFVLTLPFVGIVPNLMRKGYGFVLERNGEIIFSGPVFGRRSLWGESSNIEIYGPSDDIALAARLALPVPLGPPYSAFEHDSRSGIASTVMYEYVNMNAGPGASPARRVVGLTLATDDVLGASVAAKARFQPLLDVLRGLAIAGGDLGFKVVQDYAAAELVFSVYQPEDRTAEVVFSAMAETLSGFEYLSEGGQGNYVYVGGSGEGTARTIYETGDSQAILDYSRIEFFRDRRDTAVAAELAQTSIEELVRNTEKVVLNITPVEGPSVQYQNDWNLGTRVTVEIHKEPTDGQIELDFTYSDVVREIEYTLDGDKGESIKPIVGTPESRAIALFQAQRDLDRRLGNLERR